MLELYGNHHGMNGLKKIFSKFTLKIFNLPREITWVSKAVYKNFKD